MTTTPAGPGGGAPDPGLSAVMSERRQLIDLAYRLLGSLADAEDAVQETYARWYAMSRQQQEAPRTAARTYRVDKRAGGRHHGRPGRPHHPG